ncbi:unnamed protein product, partial [Brassica oleracea]
PVEVDLNFLEPVGKELKLLCEVRPSSSLPATEIEAQFLLSFVDAGSDLARRRRLRPSPLMPRFKSASISIAAAVPFVSAATAAPFVSDATAALFPYHYCYCFKSFGFKRAPEVHCLLCCPLIWGFPESNVKRVLRSSYSLPLLFRSACSLVLWLLLLVRQICNSRLCVRRSSPETKPPPLPSKPFPFHFSTGAAKTCAIDETRHCDEVLKLSLTCPARCADCSGSPPDAPPFSIIGRLDTVDDFPQPHTTVRWLVFGLLMITFWARLTMITADIISSRLSSVVSTGPEEATKITFGFLVGES